MKIPPLSFQMQLFGLFMDSYSTNKWNKMCEKKTDDQIQELFLIWVMKLTPEQLKKIQSDVDYHNRHNRHNDVKEE